jgi:hypothetical protein
MGHYAKQCPKKKKKQQDVSAATTEELEFDTQFCERVCIRQFFFSCYTIQHQVGRQI